MALLFFFPMSFPVSDTDRESQPHYCIVAPSRHFLLKPPSPGKFPVMNRLNFSQIPSSLPQTFPVLDKSCHVVVNVSLGGAAPTQPPPLCFYPMLHVISSIFLTAEGSSHPLRLVYPSPSFLEAGMGW